MIKRIILFSIFIFSLLVPQSSFGQFYFGRNKIQYNDFEWYILETEHFDIYYYPEMKELAEIGAAYAEKTYTFLENKFNHNVLRRIPLIFYATHSHFQETNTIPSLVPEGVGGFFEFLKGRVVIPANGSISQFKHVIRHELVHVFTHSKEQQILKNHKLYTHSGLPLWYIEGIAEFWSEGWDSQAEMFIRDAILNDYLFPLSRIYQIRGSFLMYKEGQAILRYIAEKYGEEKVLEFIDNIWMSKHFPDVFQLTLGKSYKEFDKEWTYYLKKQKFPLLDDHDSAEMVSDQVTKNGINIKPAYYKALKDSNQVDYVVFLSNRTGYSNIYIEPLLEKTEREQDKEAKAEILVAGERSSEFESFHLLSNKIDVNKSGELAFTSKSGDRDILYLYDIKDRKITNQFEFEGLVSIFSPTWSPDGQQIAFCGLAFSGKSDIYIFNRQENQLIRVTDDYFDDKEPAWSPDGRFIAFSSDRGNSGENGYYNLFVHDRETGLINYVTHGEFNDLSPTWSPDGKYIAFSSDRNGNFNIWVLSKDQSKLLASTEAVPMDMDSSVKAHPYFMSSFLEQNDLKQITHLTTGAFDPEWTANNDLLYTGFENFSYQIYWYKDIDQKFESTAPIEMDNKIIANNDWEFDKLDGKKVEKTLKYKTKYDLDIAQSQVTQDPIFGTSGGLQLAVSDMLGNYQYYFLLYNNARTKDEFLESFNVAISRIDLSRRTNFALGAYHFAGRYYNRYDFWFWERRYGGFGAISYPLSKFKRIEASLNVRYSDKEWYSTFYRRKALLVSNFVSYIKDTSLWGPTGPIDGDRVNITIGNTLDVAHSNVNFVTLIADYRKYFRLSTRVTHAVRIWTQLNQGKESTPFFMGGSWDLRGYRLWSLWGTKLGLISNELRFPFIDRFVLNFPFGGLGFSSIRGALFTDIGNTWDNELDHLLGSTGFGVRLRLGGWFVIRFDVGRKFVMNDLNRFYDFSTYTVDNDWFTQFFFGWDF